MKTKNQTCRGLQLGEKIKRGDFHSDGSKTAKVLIGKRCRHAFYIFRKNKTVTAQPNEKS
jgi:hypothetical protein